ncbi:MAG: tetratricopeptide repeat protein [Acidobacteria bacterium]|nr:tetratricopeptide repeat protein [Acidobacteriota bacterium]
MSEILDEGSWVAGVVGVLLVSLLLQTSLATPLPYLAESSAGKPLPSPFAFYSAAVLLALFYVPSTILAIALIARLGGVSYLFGRDYLPLFTCVTMAWTAAHLPVALALLALRGAALGQLVWVPGFAYFAFLMVCALRVVFGAEFGQSIPTVAVSWIPFALGIYWYREFGHIFGFLTSPFLLFYGYLYLGGGVRTLGSGMRSRQAFRRYLEICTVNDHDAEAQYQLGLIYQQRRQYTEAIARFQQAVAVDPTETDAHFQLGRIARQQGRLADALPHFQAVVDQNEKHSLSEIWREVGALHLAAKQYQAAREELTLYTARRPYDPEGLYYFGQALDKTGDTARAREVYQQAIDAVRSAPHYRRAILQRWSRLAYRELRRLAGP